MMGNKTEPIQVLLDISMDYPNQAKLIDKIYELADSLSPDDATPSMVFAQFKQELADLGLVLSLIPSDYIALTPEPAK